MQTNKLVWFILGIILMDCLIVPFFLGVFYPGYNYKTMVLSALGSKESPVRWTYNIWMACLGIAFVGIGMSLFQYYKTVSYTLAYLLLIVTIIYAVFDCLISSVFSVGSSKEMLTLAEKIHGYGSAIGCTLFVFSGLLGTILLWNEHLGAARLLLVCFILAVVTFGFFVAGEDVTIPTGNWEKIIGQTGLWQRLSFGLMYVPYLVLCLYKK